MKFWHASLLFCFCFTSSHKDFAFMLVWKSWYRTSFTHLSIADYRFTKDMRGVGKKINESIWWESIGCMNFLIKNTIYFIICKLRIIYGLYKIYVTNLHTHILAVCMRALSLQRAVRHFPSFPIIPQRTIDWSACHTCLWWMSWA